MFSQNLKQKHYHQQQTTNMQELRQHIDRLQLENSALENKIKEMSNSQSEVMNDMRGEVHKLKVRF